MSRETEATRSESRQETVTIKLDEPVCEIPEGATVVILVAEDATGTGAWSYPSYGTIKDKVAFLQYTCSFICTNLYINARDACTSVETAKDYIQTLQWLLFAINTIQYAHYFDTILLLYQRLDPLRTNILKNIITGSSVTADEIQEELLVVTRLFETMRKQSDSLKLEPMGGRRQKQYFLKLEEIRADRLQYLANRDDLCQALDLAGSLDLAGIEVGFFKEALAVSAVRGVHDPRSCDAHIVSAFTMDAAPAHHVAE
jgi:hypothetical protein